MKGKDLKHRKGQSQKARMSGIVAVAASISIVTGMTGAGIAAAAPSSPTNPTPGGGGGSPTNPTPPTTAPAPAPTPKPYAAPRPTYPVAPVYVDPQNKPVNNNSGGGNYVAPKPKPVTQENNIRFTPIYVEPVAPILPEAPNTLRMGDVQMYQPTWMDDGVLNSINEWSSVTEAEITNTMNAFGVSDDRSSRVAAATMAGGATGAVIGATAVGVPFAVVGGLAGGAIGTAVGPVVGGAVLPVVGFLPGVVLGPPVGAAIGAAGAGAVGAVIGGVAGGAIGAGVGAAVGMGEGYAEPGEPLPAPEFPTRDDGIQLLKDNNIDPAPFIQAETDFNNTVTQVNNQIDAFNKEYVDPIVKPIQAEADRINTQATQATQAVVAQVEVPSESAVVNNVASTTNSTPEQVNQVADNTFGGTDVIANAVKDVNEARDNFLAL